MFESYTLLLYVLKIVVLSFIYFFYRDHLKSLIYDLLHVKMNDIGNKVANNKDFPQN